MKKTLLLCFIHGFKGGDDTFGAKSEFAQHLAALLSAELPRLEVRAITYPKYETRGDLAECVARFRDWLLEKVIDIEVANGTPSPTVDPSVRTILVGHSMGGIVAVDTALAIAGEKVIPGLQHNDEVKESSSAASQGGEEKEENEKGDDDEEVVTQDDSTTKEVEKHDIHLEGLMFPYIQGVLAFDTPYLGISPGVVAHSAEDHYNTAATALTQISGLSGMLFGAGAGKQQQQKKQAQPETPSGTSAAEKDSQKKAGGGGGWGRWGQIAMAAGAAGAIAAGGAAAYANRGQINQGWSWATSHLEFVGCLARGEDLRRRVASMVQMGDELDVGFANLYTRLGKTAAGTGGAGPGGISMSVQGNKLLGGNGQRTFCNLPQRQAAGAWIEAVNDKAKDETGAHMSEFFFYKTSPLPQAGIIFITSSLSAMFEPEHNPGYSKLTEDSKALIVSWARNEWYETSSF